MACVCLTAPPLQLSLHAIREGAADILVQLLTSPLPEIRAAAIFGLACLVHSCPDNAQQQQQQLAAMQAAALGEARGVCISLWCVRVH